MTDKPPRRESTLQVAGEAVALLAGVVAAVYSLGGLVLAVRLLSDGFSVDAVVSLLGLAPRELLVGGGIWAAMAVIPAVLAVGVLPFEKAQLCLEGPDKLVRPLGREDQLTLIAQTKDRTILAVERSAGDDTKAKSLLTVPTTKVSRLQFGELARDLNCVSEI